VADYRLSAKVISRSQGRSATAAASYRSASEIADDRTGEIHDYTRKGGVEWTGIAAPENAPAWTQDRSKLWNAVEAAETRKNSQVAREIQLSLPHELNFEQRKALVRDFVQKEFVGRGMTADIAMHKPERRGDQRNFHAHIMLTTREIGPEGFGAKNRDWNKVETLAALRVSWAEAQNAHLRKHLGPDAPQVTHLSYVDRGADKLPTQHLGPDATAMERRGVDSEKGAYNRSIHDRNEKVKASRARQKEIETTLERRVEWSLGTVSMTARIEYRSQVDAVSAARVQLDSILDRQKALGSKTTPASLRREVLRPPDDALKTAKREQRYAQKTLAVFDERARQVNSKASGLMNWIKNPRRMMWLKLIELRERDKILKDVNARALEVLKWKAHVGVRQDWLKSDDGKAWMKQQQKPQRELRTAERKARRNAANALRKADQARELAEYARQLNRFAAQNGLPQTIVLAEEPLNPKAAYTELSRGVTQLIGRLPVAQQAALAQSVQQSIGKGPGRGRGD